MIHDKKEETKDNQFPKGIYDYWNAYEARKANKRTTPKNLIDYFRKGIEEFQNNGEKSEQIEWICKGLRRLVNKAKECNYIPATGNSKFVSAEDDEVTGTVTIDVQKNEALKYKISCTSSKIDVETIVGTAGSNENDRTEGEEASSIDTEKNDNSEETEAPSITVTMSEDDFIGMLYTDAEAKLREMGFTVFEYETLETEDINKPDDTIGAVEIKNWAFGKGDFAVGDTYEADAIVVLWYYICDEPEPNLTVENCPELAAILSNKAEIDDSYSAFATKYKLNCQTKF